MDQATQDSMTLGGDQSSGFLIDLLRRLTTSSQQVGMGQQAPQIVVVPQQQSAPAETSAKAAPKDKKATDAPPTAAQTPISSNAPLADVTGQQQQQKPAETKQATASAPASSVPALEPLQAIPILLKAGAIDPLQAATQIMASTKQQNAEAASGSSNKKSGMSNLMGVLGGDTTTTGAGGEAVAGIAKLLALF